MSPWFKAHYDRIKNDPDYLVAELSLEISERAYMRMEELGLTQAELATRMGLSQPYVAKLLSVGSNMTLMTLVKLAQALEMKVEFPQFTPIVPEPENGNGRGVKRVRRGRKVGVGG